MLFAPRTARMNAMDSAPILIGYDGSEEAARAVDVAAALFGARRSVVLAVEPPMTQAETYLVMSSAASGLDVEEVNNSEALARAGEGADRARRAGLVADAQSRLVSPAWEGIVAVADETDAAVIVVGSRDHKGIRERLEASTAHQVAVHAGRPVLIVPQHASS